MEERVFLTLEERAAYKQFFSVGDYRSAADFCLEILGRDSRHFGAICHYVKALKHDGRYEEALTFLEREEREGVSSKGLLVARASILVKIGEAKRRIHEKEEAADYFKKARKILTRAMRDAAQPEENNKVLGLLAKVYGLQGRYKNATQVLCIARRNNPWDAPILNQLGWNYGHFAVCFRNKELLRHSIRFFQKAAAIRPDDPQTRRQRSEIESRWERMKRERGRNLCF